MKGERTGERGRGEEAEEGREGKRKEGTSFAI